MQIIIDHNDVVIGATEEVTYQENGNPSVNGVMAYDKSIVKNVFEVESLPFDFEINKYKYSQGKGFILNTDWNNSGDVVDPKVLKAQMKLMQTAIDDLIFGGGL